MQVRFETPLGPCPEDQKLQDPTHRYVEKRNEHGRGYWHRDSADA
jgi:hypothetical protein